MGLIKRQEKRIMTRRVMIRLTEKDYKMLEKYADKYTKGKVGPLIREIALSKKVLSQL